jgi:O-antigen/teichoic acid export membrane protein
LQGIDYGGCAKVLKSAVLLLAGNGVSALTLLLRNLIIARLISVENYGIAATFAILIAIVEMMSQLGLQQMIVQDKDGESPDFQAGIQGFQVLRAIASALVLVLIAYPVSWFLGIPQVAWAFQLLALIPLMNGLNHFDMFRLQRHMNYLPNSVTMAVSALGSLALIWPLNAYFNDYRVMLYSILAQGLITLLLSHMLAKRPYRLAFDLPMYRRAWGFGWPLLINGMLLFLVFNGEKLIVGHKLGLAPLAIYAMGFTLTLTPTLVFSRSVQGIFLPRLSQAVGKAHFQPTAVAAVQANILGGLLLVVGVLLLGEWFVTAAFGKKYADLLPLLPWLALGQAIRVFKTGPAIVSLSKGLTTNAMWGNVARVLLLPAAWFAVANGYGLLTIAQIAVAAEVLGLGVALWLMTKSAGIDIKPVIVTVFMSFLFLAVDPVSSWLQASAGLQIPQLVKPALWILTFVLAVGSMQEFRHSLRNKED